MLRFFKKIVHYYQQIGERSQIFIKCLFVLLFPLIFSNFYHFLGVVFPEFNPSTFLANLRAQRNQQLSGNKTGNKIVQDHSRSSHRVVYQEIKVTGLTFHQGIIRVKQNETLRSMVKKLGGTDTNHYLPKAHWNHPVSNLIVNNNVILNNQLILPLKRYQKVVKPYMGNRAFSYSTGSPIVEFPEDNYDKSGKKFGNSNTKIFYEQKKRRLRYRNY